MRTLTFRATECGSIEDPGCIQAGVSNSASIDPAHTFLFAVDPSIPKAEQAIYFELDDQMQGDESRKIGRAESVSNTWRRGAVSRRKLHV